MEQRVRVLWNRLTEFCGTESQSSVGQSEQRARVLWNRESELCGTESQSSVEQRARVLWNRVPPELCGTESQSSVEQSARVLWNRESEFLVNQGSFIRGTCRWLVLFFGGFDVCFHSFQSDSQNMALTNLYCLLSLCKLVM